MFDINGFELLFIALLAVVLIGPDRLPEYVSGLRNVVKRVRAIVSDGRTALRDEFGDDVDWSQYDPRQYDPRRIVREALMDEDEVVSASPRRARRAASASGGTPVVATGAVASAAVAQVVEPVVVDPDATPMLGNPVVEAPPVTARFDTDAT